MFLIVVVCNPDSNRLMVDSQLELLGVVCSCKVSFCDLVIFRDFYIVLWVSSLV